MKPASLVIAFVILASVVIRGTAATNAVSYGIVINATNATIQIDTNFHSATITGPTDIWTFPATAIPKIGTNAIATVADITASGVSAIKIGTNNLAGTVEIESGASVVSGKVVIAGGGVTNGASPQFAGLVLGSPTINGILSLIDEDFPTHTNSISSSLDQLYYTPQTGAPFRILSEADMPGIVTRNGSTMTGSLRIGTSGMFLTANGASLNITNNTQIGTVLIGATPVGIFGTGAVSAVGTKIGTNIFGLYQSTIDDATNLPSAAHFEGSRLSWDNLNFASIFNLGFTRNRTILGLPLDGNGQIISNATFRGDGSGLTGLPGSVDTNTPRLASNVWAAADSTTNFALRAGGYSRVRWNGMSSGSNDTWCLTEVPGDRLLVQATNTDSFGINFLTSQTIPQQRTAGFVCEPRYGTGSIFRAKSTVSNGTLVVAFKNASTTVVTTQLIASAFTEYLFSAAMPTGAITKGWASFSGNATNSATAPEQWALDSVVQP